ncbi:hypothetical protein [Streptomyces sp. NPDC048385]|uniref:hypothetical protein n=1 Tax=unclassified Streptomyces TaxID=2593676 RepID=UPI003425DD20
MTSSTRGVQGIARPEELVLACERLRLALVRLARQLPLVVAVDDCEWLDAVSLRALTFVANRLAGTRVVLLAAVRAEDQGRLAGWEATRVEVEPLDEEAARLLLADHHPRLAPGVRSEVARVAEGCPLALIDLPRALTEAQRAGTAALPYPLPAGPGLDAAWGPRFTALPPATRALLVVLATVGDEPAPGDVQWAADLVGAGPEAMTAAEEAGLVTGERVPRFSAGGAGRPGVLTAPGRASSGAERMRTASEDRSVV